MVKTTYARGLDRVIPLLFDLLGLSIGPGLHSNRKGHNWNLIKRIAQAKHLWGSYWRGGAARARQLPRP